MYTFELFIEKPLKYAMTGKFEALSPNWMHSNLPLNEYELFVVTKDTLYLSYNNSRFTIPRGSFLLLPPVPPPANRRIGFKPSQCTFYWLHFAADHPVKCLDTEPHDLLQYPASAADNTLLIPQEGIVPNMDKLIVVMKQLQDAVRSEYDYSSLCYMTTVVLCELHNQLHADTAKHTGHQKVPNQTYYDIIDYIKSNINRNLKISELAAHFGYNEKYLTHLFTKTTGVSLKQFILNAKMDYANYLLTDSNKSIREISYELGYMDSRNFTKAYKKIFELTPTEYRNSFSKRIINH
jgi:AraC-like DNA-binding protein